MGKVQEDIYAKSQETKCWLGTYFCERLKYESLKIKKPITQNEELDIRRTLVIEYKNLKAPNISSKDFAKALMVKFHASNQNLITTNGINLDGVKQFVKEVAEEVWEA